MTAVMWVLAGATSWALLSWFNGQRARREHRAVEDQSIAPTKTPAPAEPPRRAPAPSFRYVLGTKTCGCVWKFDTTTGGQWAQVDICDHHLTAVAREWGVPW